MYAPYGPYVASIAELLPAAGVGPAVGMIKGPTRVRSCIIATPGEPRLVAKIGSELSGLWAGSVAAVGPSGRPSRADRLLPNRLTLLESWLLLAAFPACQAITPRTGGEHLNLCSFPAGSLQLMRLFLCLPGRACRFRPAGTAGLR